MSKDEIKRLSPYSHVRLRTPMYFGATTLHSQPVLDFTAERAQLKEFSWVPAVFCCVREIWDNSLDEVVAHGHGSKIEVTYDPETMTVTVEDDGRGIPIDWDEQHQMHKATLALSELMAGRNFDERTNTAGMNGIGASGVNFCSEYFHVDIHRDGQRFQQKFSEGNAVFGDALQIGKPKITSKQGKSGTRITFKLSANVFKDLTLPEQFLKSRITEIACANPNVKFKYNGEAIKARKGSEALFTGYEPVMISADVPDKQFESEFILVPNFVDAGDISHSLVNNIPVFNGGTQIDAFKKHFVTNLLNHLSRESKRRGLTPNRSDVLETVLIYNVTRMLKPDFDSQSKTRLINEEVETYIRSSLDDDKLYKKIARDHKTWIDAIYERCAARTQKKDDAETAKLARKVLRTKVPKLMDATGKDRTKCILLIAEGDCVHEDTSIAVLDNGIIKHIPIKDVQVGDLVLTHAGRFKPIAYKTAKIVDGLKIKTKTGSEVILSSDHRIPVFNKQTEIFELVKAGDLNKQVHRMVKSVVDLNSQFMEIYSINKFDHNHFSMSIVYGSQQVKSSIITSPDHMFQVMDMNTGNIIKVRANDLDQKTHLLIASRL
jgi:DNA gyrase/topoisomerase IV subunit B